MYWCENPLFAERNSITGSLFPLVCSLGAVDALSERITFYRWGKFDWSGATQSNVAWHILFEGGGGWGGKDIASNDVWYNKKIGADSWREGIVAVTEIGGDIVEACHLPRLSTDVTAARSYLSLSQHGCRESKSIRGFAAVPMEYWPFLGTPSRKACIIETNLKIVLSAEAWYSTPHHEEAIKFLEDLLWNWPPTPPAPQRPPLSVLRANLHPPSPGVLQYWRPDVMSKLE